MLSQLLQSKDPHVAARQNIDSLTEEFFMVSSTYLEMVGVRSLALTCSVIQRPQYTCDTRAHQNKQELQAKKEKNSAVAKQLEGALKAAMEEKQKTLRPEIQLLNNLLAVNSRTARKQACFRIVAVTCCTLCMLSADAPICRACRALHLLSSSQKLMSP